MDVVLVFSTAFYIHKFLKIYREGDVDEYDDFLMYMVAMYIVLRVGWIFTPVGKLGTIVRKAYYAS